MSATRTITGVDTETLTETVVAQSSVSLQQPQEHRGVSWAEGTVDNENLGKKSSKCCCIYKKPKKAGESSSESEASSDDDTNPYEKVKKPKKHSCHHDHSPSNSNASTSTPA